jgi:hydroxymethylpyrimidine/phosphomethylpyrimidine kinase
MKIALTIAGSDSGGGAGIQADLKTFNQFGVFGTSVITAITAQNTVGVRAVHPVPPAMVRAQLEALAEDLPPAGFKTGMLATAELVRMVAAAIHEFDWPNYVCGSRHGRHVRRPAAGSRCRGYLAGDSGPSPRW